VKKLFSILPERSFHDIEAAMRNVSLAASALASILMVAGLLDLWFAGMPGNLPAVPAVPLRSLLRLQGGTAGILALSAGIVLLSVVPTVRVVLALGIYLRQGRARSAVISLIVILELLVSFYHGG